MSHSRTMLFSTNGVQITYGGEVADETIGKVDQLGRCRGNQPQTSNSNGTCSTPPLHVLIRSCTEKSYKALKGPISQFMVNDRKLSI